MVRSDVIASHVETLLERMLDTKDLAQDRPGEWSIRNGTALYTVRVKDDVQHPHVEVYSIAVDGVKPTKALYERINQFNANASHSRWFLDGTRVIVAGELIGETLDPEELQCTCSEVALGADQGGQVLSEAFGGEVSFPADTEEPHDKPDLGEPTGLYL